MAGAGGATLLVAGACLAGCLAAPVPAGGGDPGDEGDASIDDDDATGGLDAALPVCGDGTALNVAHVSEIAIPRTDLTIPLGGLAVFMNSGTTVIQTGQIEVVDVTTVGSADLDIAIADGVGELPPGEAHGYLDETSRPLMMELVAGFWSDQGKPQVFGSISHEITSGTFEGTIVYGLGTYQLSVDITFSVGGETGAIGGQVFDAVCE